MNNAIAVARARKLYAARSRDFFDQVASDPSDWRDLQEHVADIFHKCRFKVEVEKTIESARGKVEVDVYAEETIQGRRHIIMCECKHWKANISQTVVHAFRTVVADTAANVGFIITTSNYQPGAIAASVLTNIRLRDWRGFQKDSVFP